VAQQFDFNLRLVDSVSATGKKAADAVRNVNNEAKKAQKSLDFSKELHKTEEQLKRLKFDPSGYKKLIEAQKELSEARKKLGKESFFGAFKEKMSFGKTMGAAFLGDLLAESLIEGAKKAVEIVFEGVKKAFEAGAAAENLRLGAKLTLGKGAGEFNEDVGRFSKMTGLDDDAIKGMLLPVRRAGFDQKGARSAFAIAADLAAANGKGGDQGQISGVLDTLTDIRLKGGVGEKRLVSMGVNAPEFYKSLGKKLKVSAASAKDRAEGGKVDPQLLINTIGEAVEKQQGGKLGTGAIAYSKTFEARSKKLFNLPEEYLKSVSESPAWTALSDRMGKALEALDPDGPRGKKIVGALVQAFEKLVGYVDKFMSPENIDKFADGVTSVVDMLGKIPSYLNTIVTASEVLATIWAGSKIVGAVSSLATLLPGVATVAGGAVAAIAPLAAPLLAVAAAAGAVAFAIGRIQSTAQELGGWDAVMRDFKDWGSGKGPAIASGNMPKDMTWNESTQSWKPNKKVDVNAPTVINVHGVDADTGKKAGADIHKNMVNAYERASMQGG
jgi:hypothetical protein